MRVIAFTGKKRSGKDSAATTLDGNTPNTYEIISFAAPLKRVCEKYLGGYGIIEQNRELVRVFRVQLRDIVKAMGELGFQKNLSFAFTERVIEVFKPFIISLDDRFIEIQCSYRQILQLFGTDVCRHFNQEIWVDKAIEAIDNAHAAGKDVIITDLRFDDEAKMLREKYDSLIIEIVRDLCYNNHRESDSEHLSERGVDREYVDLVVFNNKSLDEYKEKLIGLVEG